MNNVCVYYNLEHGYIFVSETSIIDNGMSTTLKPVISFKENLDIFEIGNIYFKCLDKSRYAVPIEYHEAVQYKFWEEIGYKSYAVFSKIYQCISINADEKNLYIYKLKRDKRGAFLYPPSEDKIIIPITTKPEIVGGIIINLFGDGDIQEKSSFDYIETLYDSKIMYIPPDIPFIDIGDGHTDAYKIYVHENDSETYIGFFIDSGYQKFSKFEIKNCWKRYFGKMSEFVFEKKNLPDLKFVAKGKSDNSIINSYFYADGDALVEIQTKINYIDKTIEELKSIADIFDNVIGSITFLKK